MNVCALPTPRGRGRTRHCTPLIRISIRISSNCTGGCMTCTFPAQPLERLMFEGESALR